MNSFTAKDYITMSGHSEDPVAEESERFFTFFNLIYASCCYYRHRNRYYLC